MAGVVSPHCECYTRLMMREGRGFPMYYPQPLDDLPYAYRLHGALPGDVGRITSLGAFDFFWNIYRAADDAVNRGRTPPEFVPLPADDNLQQLDDLDPPMHLISNATFQQREGRLIASVQGTPMDIGAQISINATSSEGAFLFLPHGSSYIQTRSTSRVRDYLCANANSWYRYLNANCDMEVHNGSLMVITGCDKTDKWAIASYANHNAGGNLGINFPVPVASLNAVYSWQNAITGGLGVARGGPRTSLGKNQAPFIRGYHISIREGLLGRLLGEIKVKDDARGHVPFGTARIPYGSTNQQLPRSEPRRQPEAPATQSDIHSPSGSSAAIVEAMTPGNSQLHHPAVAINDYLLGMAPEATVALTHDDEWASVIREYELGLPSDEHMLQIIKSRSQNISFSRVNGQPLGVFLSPQESIAKSEEDGNTLQTTPTAQREDASRLQVNVGDRAPTTALHNSPQREGPKASSSNHGGEYTGETPKSSLRPRSVNTKEELTPGKSFATTGRGKAVVPADAMSKLQVDVRDRGTTALQDSGPKAEGSTSPSVHDSELTGKTPKSSLRPRLLDTKDG